ncbi:hypothetical protein [Enterococcus phage G01]|nr:hypothetical protein [Enterococcus phage G01]
MDFQIGTVKKTKGQVKKHASQFTHKEVEQVYKARERVKDLWLKRGIKIGFHLQDKIRNGETKFSYEMTMKTMLSSTIVEYNETGADKRILLRSHYSKHGEVQCIVVSLLSGKVITSYLNKVDDVHKTLDQRRYNKNLKINLPKHLTK